MTDSRITDFIAEHHVLTIACLSRDGGEIWCANAFYVFDPDEVVFIITSSEDTLHARMFLENPSVAGSVVLETEEIGKIRGLQFSGKVRRCEGGLFDRSRLRYLKRFPYAVFKGGEVWQIVPDVLKYTDNRLGFGKKLYWRREKEGESSE